MSSLTLTVEPLAKEAFEPFGEVIEPDPSRMRLINGGTTERYHALFTPEAVGEDARIIVSLFRGQPRQFPYAITMMERHPLGSQSFSPLSSRPFLVAVSPDMDDKPGRPRIFLATGGQGVNYRRGTWHHPLMALRETSDFLVVDREGSDNNLEEYFYDQPFVVTAPSV
jgi:ureidoglycolate lyase